MNKFAAAPFLTLLPLTLLEDYWINYDVSDNCREEYLMDRLKKIPLRCAEVSKGTRTEQIEECKAMLGHQLLSSCPFTEVEVKHEEY